MRCEITASEVSWDPLERLLSVQSSGCYNISTVAFHCYSNLGTEKFMQYHIPANPPASPTRVVKASYAYVQATNYYDGLAMVWSGLASVATPDGERGISKPQMDVVGATPNS